MRREEGWTASRGTGAQGRARLRREAGPPAAPFSARSLLIRDLRALKRQRAWTQESWPPTTRWEGGVLASFTPGEAGVYGIQHSPEWGEI